MKISSIKIKDFHQFENLVIDLTYPKGHTKEGKPLEKVCFIGQSGTGKTSILETIPYVLVFYPTQFVKKSGPKSLFGKFTLSVKFGKGKHFSADLSLAESEKEGTYQRLWKQPTIDGLEVEPKELMDYFKVWTKQVASKPIYFPANLNYDLDTPSEKNTTDTAIVDFSKEKVSFVWNLFLEEIQSYQEQELRIRQDISKMVEQASNDFNAIQVALNKLKEWKQNEYNPIQDIADHCLDKLLEPFRLRVKTELDIKSKDEIGFIKIEDFEGNEIPNGLWSTGTKQVILSAMPLYLLKPKNTIIFFDEPERSLYPDLQRFIVEYYSSLANDCQFFYSTHSPVIASSFEPWEIVELKFNKHGKVFRELYFEGDNHVDNYKWDPRLMRWDDILQRIFDLKNDGSNIRKEKLEELAKLNVRYRKLNKSAKSDTTEKIEIEKRIEQLSKELSKWN